ncbi:MAG TPA: outer membrane lipoprotein-sorting protein [Verrucomicrobiae bacterium]
MAGAQPRDLTDADIQGIQLAQKILAQQPDQDVTNTGKLQIRNANGTLKEVPVKFTVTVTPTNWSCVYGATVTNQNGLASNEVLSIVHDTSQTNVHETDISHTGGFFDFNGSKSKMTEAFAGSDFWVCDLTLRFLSWTDQKIIKKEFMRGRGCMVLESKNSLLALGGYSRVDSWIDEETLGIVHAVAYDADGNLLKVFDPKSFKKVNGQWELQDMEIRNVQTGSRTRIEFDLGK